MGKFCCNNLRRTVLYDHLDAPRGQGFMGFLQPLEHEVVVAFVGLRKIVGQPKADEYWFVHVIRLFNRILEGMIVLTPLRLLHPVQNILLVRDWLHI